MQTKWHQRLNALATGAVSFGFLQAVGDINFNQVWFGFLTNLLNLIVAALFGADASLFMA